GFWPKLVSAIGFLACLGALVVLVVQLVLYDVATLLLIAGSLALVSGLRLAFVRHQRGSTAGSMV
ncbi:MAG: hypothetical protein ABIP92_05435, partial [Arthrobacter sp.]